MIKHILKLFIAFMIVLIASNCMAHETLILRTAEVHPDDYPTSLALYYMSDRLKEWSGNRLALKIYTGGQLGDERDTLEITIFGGIDINRINMAPLNSIAPETIVLGLPFLFRSTAHMRAVVDGDIGQEILSALEAFGLIGLAFYDSGARSFYNTKHPIHTPGDMKGLKIRVQNSELAVAMVKALGANPTPMGFGQVYESLLLGTVDGSENNWPSYEASKHYEVAPHYTLTRHTMTPEVLVMSKYRWDKLNPEQQLLIKRAAKDSVVYMRLQWDKRIAASKTKVTNAKVKIISEPNIDLFYNAVKPIYKQFLITHKLRHLAERIQAVKATP